MILSDHKKTDRFVELIHQCEEHLAKLKKSSESEPHYLYYFYCDGGLYDDEDGEYYKVDNYEELTLHQCIDYVNECRKNNKVKPIQIIKIKRWRYGKFEWITI